MYYIYNNIKIKYYKYGNKNKVILILPGWGNTTKTFYNIINHYNLQYNFRIYSIYSKRTFIVPPHAIPNFAATVLDKS